MFRSLGRLLGAVQDHPGTPPLRALVARVEQLERAEIERSAEHHAQLDRLDRLYKRLSARIGREKGQPSPDDGSSVLNDSGGSVLELRKRLGR